MEKKKKKKKIPRPGQIVIDFGGGKGDMSLFVQRNLKACPLRHVIVDRIDFRAKLKKDMDVLHEGGALCHRIVVDIRDVDLGAVVAAAAAPNCSPPEPASATDRVPHTVAVAKHLCGVAFDLMLRSLQTLPPAGRPGALAALAAAPCCHHCCEWGDFVGSDAWSEAAPASAAAGAPSSGGDPGDGAEDPPVMMVAGLQDQQQLRGRPQGQQQHPPQSSASMIGADRNHNARSLQQSCHEAEIAETFRDLCQLSTWATLRPGGAVEAAVAPAPSCSGTLSREAKRRLGVAAKRAIDLARARWVRVTLGVPTARCVTFTTETVESTLILG
jgi:hypothetical protein